MTSIYDTLNDIRIYSAHIEPLSLDDVARLI